MTPVYSRRRQSLVFFGISIFACVLTGLPACSGDGNGRNDGGGSGDGSSGSGGTGGAGAGGSASSTGGAVGSGGAATGGRGGGGSGGASAGGGGSATGGRGGSSGAAATGGSARGGHGGDASGGGSVSGGRGGDASGGGSASGGRGGNAGSGIARPECVTASDCKLASDCCTCAALPVGEAPPACNLVCIQSRCAAQQLPPGAVACVAGRCVAGFDCDASKVTCKIAVPVCPAGEVPGVNADGSCYAGGCVPAVECKTVSNCAACTGAEEACATYETQMGPRAHCVSVPATCGNTATCGCLGPTTCVSPFAACAQPSGAKGVSCSCPTC